MLKLVKISEFPYVQVWILTRCASEVRQCIEYLWRYVVVALGLRLIGNA
jgi:hypothetical protein